MRRLHRAPSGDRFVSCWWWHLAYWVEGWIWICFPSFAVWLYLHRFTVVSMLDQLSVKLKEGDKLGAIFQRILMSFSFQRPQLSFFKDFKWFPYLKVWLCGSFVWFSFLSGDDFSFHWLNTHKARGAGAESLTLLGQSAFSVADVTKVTLLPCEKRTQF